MRGNIVNQKVEVDIETQVKKKNSTWLIKIKAELYRKKVPTVWRKDWIKLFVLFNTDVMFWTHIHSSTVESVVISINWYPDKTSPSCIPGWWVQ